MYCQCRDTSDMEWSNRSLFKVTNLNVEIVIEHVKIEVGPCVLPYSKIDYQRGKMCLPLAYGIVLPPGTRSFEVYR